MVGGVSPRDSRCTRSTGAGRLLTTGAATGFAVTSMTGADLVCTCGAKYQLVPSIHSVL